MGKGTTLIFFQKRHSNSHRHMKRCSAITNHQGHANLNHRELSPHIWLLTKRQEIASIVEDVEKRKLLCTVDEKVNWLSYYGKYYGGSLKNKK